MPFRIVLHGAAAKRVETGINAIILPTERGEISHKFGFADLGER
jgi:hypothetical protein